MVSVIIPNYNHAPYLEQRIASVLHQTWQELEIILLDDCSTDGSAAIMEKYRGHPKVAAVLYNAVNSGSTFHQWVKGIEACTAAYVWIAESDDWCEPSFLETIMTGMLQDPHCVIGYCQSFCIREANIIQWTSTHPQVSDYINGKNFIRNYLLPGTAIFNASMAVWKRSAFNSISREFTRYRYCGDWLFWIELCMHGNVFISGKLLNYFRKHSGDVSGKANALGNSFMEELKMFHLLYQRRWIGFDELMKTLKHAYIHYQAVKATFTAAKNRQIISLFYAEPGVKAGLQHYYRAFYAKHAVKKIFKKLTGY